MKNHSGKIIISGLKTLSLVMLAALALASCKKGDSRSHGVNLMEESELLAIYDRDGYDEVYIVSPKGDEVAHYVLVEEEDSIPAGLEDDVVVLRVPLTGLVIDSEIYASALEELGKTGSIKGMFDASYVTSAAIQQRLKNGEIQDVGQPASPNTEKILKLQPDALVISYFDGMQTQAVDKLGIPVIKMFDLQETSPLGRAEWIRLIGKLVGASEKADSVYYDVKEKYNALLRENLAGEFRPKVLTDTMYEGIWYVPGGNSYQARLIKDGGGNYFKSADGSSGSLNLTAEQVLMEGGDADIWLVRHYGDGNQLKAILEADPVYGEVKAYKDGNVYFSDTSKSGLFREFPFHPDRLLQDYRIIFSGDTTSALRYFEKLNLPAKRE